MHTKFKRPAKLLFMRKDLGRKAHFKTISQELTSALVFRQVLQDANDPFKQLQREKGQRISKKLSSFLRHNLPEEKYSILDGTLGIAVIQSKLGYTEDEILLATHPAFGHKGDDGLMKRRFIIVDHIHPDQSKETRVAALGGHSLKIWAPGHHSLRKESLS